MGALSVRSFDHDYVDDVMKRLGRVQADAKPAWGRMDRASMIYHLAEYVQYSTGQAGDLPDQSNWFTRNVIGPLMAHGIIRIPKNAKTAIEPDRSPLNDILEPDPDKYLLRVLDGYLARVQADEIDPRPHPLFGHIGIDGWAKAHMVHFEHHLRQFGV